MAYALAETFEILERTPATLDALLRGTSPAWHRADEGPGTWSPLQVVGHLIVGDEANWLPRARMILESGDSRPFAPFDRFAHLTRFGDAPLDDLLDRFAALRRATLATVRGWELTDRQLALPGLHPELGPVTLRELLSTWAVHDLAHVAQVARVMARRYTAEVGGWQAYLSILNPR